jgi:hypothetical protein
VWPGVAAARHDELGPEGLKPENRVAYFAVLSANFKTFYQLDYAGTSLIWPIYRILLKKTFYKFAQL